MENPTPNNNQQNNISNFEGIISNSNFGDIGQNLIVGNNNRVNIIPHKRQLTPEEENEKNKKLEMLNNLEKRYENRLNKKTDGKNLKIEFESKYTKVGTPEKYQKGDTKYYKEGQTVDAETLYNDFFKRKQLLIIGEAGSGKTVLLLTIAKKLIAEAKNRIDNNDISFPYPILLNLATWRTEDEYTFKKWLEKNLVYEAGRSGVPKKTAKYLVEENNMVLLLDGLDEIPKNDRKGCLIAMRRYFKEKSRNNVKFPEGIICCRKEEYLHLKQNLPIRAITEIVPLTLENIKEQLKIKDNTESNKLLEIIDKYEKQIHQAKYLTTAFEVNIAITLTESHLKDFSLKKLEKLETQNLIDAYINQEVKEVKGYEPKQTKHYLSFLAKKLQESKKGITFELIDMHSGWLNTLLFQIIYTVFFCLGAIISFSTTQSFFGLITLFFLPLIFIISKEPVLFAIKNSNNIHSAYHKIWLSSFTTRNLKLYIYLCIPLLPTFLLEIPLAIKTLAAIIVLLKIIFVTNIFRYFLLMLCLYIEKNSPLNLVSFLNKVSGKEAIYKTNKKGERVQKRPAVEGTGLMEKDGGQWRFRHQLIQDRLAGKEIKKNEFFAT